MSRIAATLLFGIAAIQGAHAGCPQELAVYSDAGGTLSLEFSPNEGASMMASNVFRVAMANDIVLDGMVLWNNGVSRPNGIMMHGCPEGDATGDEIRACTVWEGVVYSIGGAGEVDLLPPEGEPAAATILLPDLGRAVRYSAIWGEDKVTEVPWDALTLSGCQE